VTRPRPDDETSGEEASDEGASDDSLSDGRASYWIDLYDEAGAFVARHRVAFGNDAEATAYATRVGSPYVTLIWQGRRLVAYFPPASKGHQRESA
jgi:hypothetical protein